MRQGGRALAGIIGAAALTLAAGVSAVGAPGSDTRPAAVAADGPVQVTGTPTDVATGLKVPWSILQLHDAAGTVLISERDTGAIERIDPAGGLDKIGTVPGVHHVTGGEGGLLGLATLVDGGTRWIYAYLSTTTDNRIVRMTYTDPGDPADATLGAPQVILSGLRTSTNHNGGRIAFGPDGMLYATVGDTNDRTTPQNLSKLNGKILRMTPTGGVPGDNPFAGSLVYSYGHRNPQGLAWDDDGDLWSSELGQNTWDEFNKIVPGGNYGWPVVEGVAHDSRYIDPWQQWPTDQASPSGLAYIDGTFFMASLGGKRLWTIYVDKTAHTARSSATFINTLGRLRDVAEAPDGSLWILTNNTSRGTPKPGDDRLVRVALVPTAKVDGTLDCTTCPIAGGVAFDVALQRLVSGRWVEAQRVRVTGGPAGGRDFAFTAMPAGTYRIYTYDRGGDGYWNSVTASFAVAANTVHHAGTIRPRPSQLDRDLNGDGLADILAVDANGALLTFDGIGTGGFDPARVVEADWSAAVSTAQVGDFDGDGAADAVSRDATGALWLHRGDGAGGWTETVQLSGARAGINLLLGPGDWDGDARPDLITRDTAGLLWLWKGKGTGALGAPKQISHGWASLVDVFPVGDFTGDLRPDLVARTAAGDLTLYPGNGSGGFGTKRHLSSGWKTLTAVFAAGDVTGDGHGDILARTTDGDLRVYRGLGTGKLTIGATYPGAWAGLSFAS